MKNSFLSFSRLLLIVFSIITLFSHSAFAVKEYVKDVASGETLMEYDKETKEVKISEGFPKMELASSLKVDKHFKDTYGFLPRIIYFEKVVYEYSGNSYNGIMTIRSLGGSRLIKNIVDAFDIGKYGQCKLKELNIIGEAFEKLPSHLFEYCTLRYIRMGQTRISYIDDFALGDCHEELELLEFPQTISTQSFSDFAFGSCYQKYPSSADRIQGNGGEIIRRAISEEHEKFLREYNERKKCVIQ